MSSEKGNINCYSNPAFSGGDEISSSIKKKEGGMELKEKYDTTKGDYDPYAHREVEHPTT